MIRAEEYGRVVNTIPRIVCYDARHPRVIGSPLACRAGLHGQQQQRRRLQQQLGQDEALDQLYQGGVGDHPAHVGASRVPWRDRNDPFHAMTARSNTLNALTTAIIDWAFSWKLCPLPSMRIRATTHSTLHAIPTRLTTPKDTEMRIGASRGRTSGRFYF